MQMWQQMVEEQRTVLLTAPHRTTTIQVSTAIRVLAFIAAEIATRAAAATTNLSALKTNTLTSVTSAPHRRVDSSTSR